MPLSQPMTLPDYRVRSPRSNTRVTFEFTPREGEEGHAIILPITCPTFLTMWDTTDYALTLAYNYLDNFEYLCTLIDTHQVEVVSYVRI